MLDCRRIANSTTCLGIDGAVPALRGKYPITVRHELDETKIVPLVTELHEAHDVVVIDTAGAASQATIFAIGCADLVLYPSRRRARISSRPSRVNLIKSASQMMRKEIPTRVVLTAVQPGTNIAEHIEKEVTKASLPVLSRRLHRLVAFQEMSFTGIPPTTGLAGVQCSNFLCHETPLAAHVVKAAQGKLSKHHYRFDDPEHRLRRLFAKRIELSPLRRLQPPGVGLYRRRRFRPTMHPSDQRRELTA